MVDGVISTLTRERGGARLITQAAVTAGMTTLLGDARSRPISGQTTIEEVVRVEGE